MTAYMWMGQPEPCEKCWLTYALILHKTKCRHAKTVNKDENWIAEASYRKLRA